MTGRPRSSVDPDGRYARRRARDKMRYALKLLAGEQVRNYGHHHSAMRLLKGLMEDPHPEACVCGDEQVTLSLAKFDSPAVYWGVRYVKGQEVPYLLSSNHEDYVWECHACNHLRDESRRAA